MAQVDAGAEQFGIELIEESGKLLGRGQAAADDFPVLIPAPQVLDGDAQACAASGLLKGAEETEIV